MYPIFYDELSTKMYPSQNTHNFAVAGKISGSIGAIGEIGGDVKVVLHAPIGCGYHYKNSARRRHQPFFPLFCTDLTEEEIVYGGSDKLRSTVREVWERYHPKRIFVIPSPITDILNEDILSVARELREEGIPVADITSELFSHRDKTYAKRRMKELSKLKVGGDSRLEIELLGCGFSEALCAMVDHVMEPCDVIPHSINIETVGWGSEGSIVLREIEKTLNKAGITVNTWLPSTDIEVLGRAPAAQLNVVKRIHWAKHMQDRFKTPYMHINDAGRYVGLDGVRRFYMDIAEQMGMGREMEPVLDEECRWVREETADAREKMKGFNCVLECRGLANAPFRLKTYAKELGLNISKICVILTERMRITSGIDAEVEGNLMARLRDSVELYAPGAEIVMNPDKEQRGAIYAQADAIVGGNDASLEGQGCPVIPDLNVINGLSFGSYVRTVKRMARRLDNRSERRELILNRMPFTVDDYPRIATRSTTASRIVWEQMWLDKSKENG